MNQRLLSALARLRTDRGLLGDSANLDFTTLPTEATTTPCRRTGPAAAGAHCKASRSPWGRTPTAACCCAATPASAAVLEFLDFSRRHGAERRYLVFDGRFATYANLAKLDRAGFRFVTLRRRGKKLDAELRPITLRDGGHRRPTLPITNDFESAMADLLRRYARRCLIEKSIAEQLGFFHLNRLDSSMAVKVDFDPDHDPAGRLPIPAAGTRGRRRCLSACCRPTPTSAWERTPERWR